MQKIKQEIQDDDTDTDAQSQAQSDTIDHCLPLPTIWDGLGLS